MQLAGTNKRHTECSSRSLKDKCNTWNPEINVLLYYPLCLTYWRLFASLVAAMCEYTPCIKSEQITIKALPWYLRKHILIITFCYISLASLTLEHSVSHGALLANFITFLVWLLKYASLHWYGAVNA